MVTLVTCGVGVGWGVLVGIYGVEVTGGSDIGGTVVAGPPFTEPLRLMLTSTTTARMTASRSMPPNTSCQRELLAARSPAGVALFDAAGAAVGAASAQPGVLAAAAAAGYTWNETH